MDKLVWGVLSTARIAVEKVIPPMRHGRHCEVRAIASRDVERARYWAERLGLPRAYGSYEDLLADPEIDAVYNPLPNHLHVEWTTKAAEAGKHILCEKPIARTAAEALPLLDVQKRTGRYVQEAFMVRTHPQWLEAREIVRSGRIGQPRAIQGFFSYFNVDPNNIRNQADIGGGGLRDIGCYPTTISRFVLGREPLRALATIESDPTFGIDRLGSAILEFPGADGGPPVPSGFVWSTQLVPYQRMQFFGTEGRLEVEIPFNAPADRPCRLFFDRGTHLQGKDVETIEIPTCDQYGVAGDAFSRAVLEGLPQPVPLEDSMANMRVLDALLRSAESGRWETP